MDTALTQTIELVRLAQDGDAAALDRLIQRYYVRVRVLVRARMGAALRAHRDSGDLLQKTFAAAVQRFDRFEMRDEGSLIHWLAKLAEHQIQDAVRHDRAKKRAGAREVRLAETAATDVSPLGVPSPATGPADAAASREDHELVEASLEALPDHYRELILLRDYAGMPWDRIAEETGRPTADAARMMHAQAMVALSREVHQRRPSAGPHG